MSARSTLPRELRDEVLARDEGRCVCGGDPIRGYDYSIQHRAARGMGGSKHANRPSNLILLCGSATTGCHGWVEANPAAARRLGFRVPAGTDPASWPLLWRGEHVRHLTDDGWAPLPAEEGARP